MDKGKGFMGRKLQGKEQLLGPESASLAYRTGGSRHVGKGTTGGKKGTVKGDDGGGGGGKEGGQIV